VKAAARRTGEHAGRLVANGEIEARPGGEAGAAIGVGSVGAIGKEVVTAIKVVDEIEIEIVSEKIDPRGTRRPRRPRGQFTIPRAVQRERLAPWGIFSSVRWSG
jgi:hypothetical protein